MLQVIGNQHTRDSMYVCVGHISNEAIPMRAYSPGFPLGLENLEKWEGIFQSGKSQGIFNRLEKSGKSQGKSHKILENSGNLR